MEAFHIKKNQKGKYLQISLTDYREEVKIWGREPEASTPTRFANKRLPLWSV